MLVRTWTSQQNRLEHLARREVSTCSGELKGTLIHLVIFAIHLVHRDVVLAVDLLAWWLPPLALAL